jgi:hypothetical protein
MTDKQTPSDVSARLAVLVLLLAAAVLAAVVWYAFHPHYIALLLESRPAAGLSFKSWLLWSAAVVLIVGLLMHMQAVFTAPLEREAGTVDAQGRPVRRDDSEAIRRIMRFGYSAMTLALVLSVLLFMVPFIWTEGEGAATRSPIGVLKGCRSYPERIGSTFISEVDDPLSCEIHGPQWLLNIGGVVTPLYQLLGQDRRFSAEPRSLVEEASLMLTSIVGGLADRLDDFAGGDGAPGLPEDQARRVRQDLVQINRQMQQLGRTGCIVDAGGSTGCGFAVKGGLVLPLYLVVFSLFGGAISMTRRLPEYQRRVTDAYRDDYEQERRWYPKLKPPISPEQLREYVVFQVMQTLSAPLIAATAYSLLEPSNQASVVVIGFVAGFASEPILLRLRMLAEQISGSMEATGDGQDDKRGSREAAPPPPMADRRGRSERSGTPREPGRLARVRREREALSPTPAYNRSAGTHAADTSGAVVGAGERTADSDVTRRSGARPGGRRERVRRLLAGTDAGSAMTRDRVMP